MQPFQALNPPEDAVFTAKAALADRVVDHNIVQFRAIHLEVIQDSPSIGLGTLNETTHERRRPIAGMRCIAETSEFRTEFTTPAKVRLPVIQGKPSTMRVRCKGQGYSGTEDIPPLLSGTVVIHTSALGVVAAIAMGAVIKERDKWDYGSEGALVYINVEPDAE